MGRKMQSGTMGLGNLKAGSAGAANYGRGMQAGGRLKSRIGLGASRLGGAMQRNPGLTGGLVAGGGAAGAGGIGASMFNRKR